MKGRIIQGDPSILFDRFNFDSRRSCPGELFFALKAERDGHSFIPHARKMGAAGAVVSEPVAAAESTFAIIQVGDTLEALQELGHSVLKDYPVRIIGITGSIGKTSTKAFAAAVLGTRLEVLESEKNYNNHIGVPLSLLRLNSRHQAAVLEMGMSSPGEILRLTEIAPPDLAVITNIQPVHLEFFSSIEEIARGKKEILDGMPPGGTAVLNGDDERTRKIAAGFKGKTLLFGSAPDCHIRATDIRINGMEGIDLGFNFSGEKGSVRLPFFYRSYVYNFLAAAAVGSVFGIPLKEVREAGERLQALPMRGQLIRLRNMDVVDDTYNSNPSALQSALESLAAVGAPRHVAVLGDMLELGPEEDRFHTEAGKQAHRLGWDCLITIGPLSRSMAEGARKAGMKKENIHIFDDADEVNRSAGKLFRRGDLILVKGSRGIRTDKIVEFLRKGQ
jgi:UDP-N-acetylmuramoyl-tripeptide--D-alanyl-D-alanine ligase